MKSLWIFAVIGLFCVPSTFANEMAGAPLVGVWDLREFTFTSPGGLPIPFCPGAYGKLIYEVGGAVSVGINCQGSIPQDAPAQGYGGMLFYLGTFTIQGKSVLHNITNSNIATLVGQSVVRAVNYLDQETLVLGGQLGATGQVLRIEWARVK